MAAGLREEPGCACGGGILSEHPRLWVPLMTGSFGLMVAVEERIRPHGTTCWLGDLGRSPDLAGTQFPSL